MLSHLTVHNFALIRELALDFSSGLTVLTGETGAGKSIIIDAVVLALGERATSTIVPAGYERCVVNAAFNVDHLPLAQTWLLQHELNSNERECLLRRVITSDGRSRSFINGHAVPLHYLRELGSLLISIHGQHEHHTLLKTEKQRHLLDSFAGHHTLIKQVESFYSHWREAEQQLTTWQQQQQQRTAQMELLHYQLEELAQLNLAEAELEQIEVEQQQLTHADRLLTTAQHALNVLDENEAFNVLHALHKIHNELTSLLSIDSRLTPILELLHNAQLYTQEASGELSHYCQQIELNPERLNWVEQRLSSIYELARKYRIPATELLLLEQRLRQELQELQQNEIQLTQLAERLEQLKQAYFTAATALTTGRQQTAMQLGPAVSNIMQQLGMPGGCFEVRLLPLANNEASRYGQENVEFYVSANPGQSLQPLAKIASGGELSRISLALQVLTMQQQEMIGTLIFDEVDVGIGGGTAELVGRLLRQLGNRYQVLCVTHLPQVAALGHHHFQVGKIIQPDETHTYIQQLNQEAKIEELARMLGGLKITKQTLKHAREMLENASA